MASETAGLHPSVGEELVRISGSCPGCSGGKRRRERLVYRRRRCAYITALFSDWRHPYQGQGVVLGAPLSLVSAGWLLGPPGKEEPLLPAPLLVEPFECGCATGFLLRFLGSSEQVPTPTSVVSCHLCIAKTPRPLLSPDHSPVGYTPNPSSLLYLSTPLGTPKSYLNPN